jgi:hypothetical protein
MSERDRKALLLKMYDQMFNDINRHILVVWQSIGMLLAAFTIFSLSEKQIISIHLASGLIVLLCTWLIGHVYDASFWYNRNLVIIANIERQFLKTSDLKNIHSYFSNHRDKNKMITHLKLQYALALGIVFLILGHHFYKFQVSPDRTIASQRGAEVLIPYLVLLLCVLYLMHLRRGRNKSYAVFLKNSPGKNINVSVDHQGTHGQVLHSSLAPLWKKIFLSNIHIKIDPPS